MADFTALAGLYGLSAALENIQDRRLREAQLQQKLTEGQGTWAPVTDRPSGWDILDQFLGYNRPGQASFGGQRYGFTPHPMMTEHDVRGLGLTMPDTITTPAYEKPLPTGMHGPLELVPEQQTTRDIPLPGFVGTRMDPKTRQALALETFKERRAERQRAQVQKLLEGLITQDEADAAREPAPAPGTPAGTPGGITPPALTKAEAPPAATGQVPGADKMSPQFMAKAQKISNDLGMRLDDFLRVMSFETAGSFAPDQKNLGGKSSGTGLIQFLSKTAKGLGTTTEALAAMTPEQQLDYVAKYLAPYKGKIGNLQDLYMAVLNPSLIGASGNAPVFSKDKNPAEYAANAPLDAGNKGYITVSDALNAVMRKTGGTAAAQSPAAAPAQPGTSMMVAGPGAPAPQAPPSPTALRDQARLQKLESEIPLLQKRLVVLSGHTGAEATAALALGRQVLSDKVTERNTLRNQLGETERAVEKEKALQPIKLDQARIEADAAAARALAAKGEERIGVEAGRKMNLPPTTKWKDVPGNVKTYEDPSPTERKVFADLKGSAAGVERLLTALDNPEVAKIIGTWFSAPEDKFARVVGDYLATATPAQRKFFATLAREVSEIRHQLAGASQTVTELKGLQPFLPSPDDVDATALRAKLEALREGIVRSHDSYRDQLDQVGIRTPKALSRPEPKPSTSTTGSSSTGSSAQPSTQDKLLKKYAR